MDKPVKLCETKPRSLTQWLHLIMEYGLFFRWILFKNRPRGNFLLVRSVLGVGFQGSLYFLLFGDVELLLLGIEIDPVIALGILVTLAFWNMSRTYQDKTKLCLNCYQDILAAVADSQIKKAEILATNLALTLLSMDFWAHPLFSGAFFQALERAIYHQPAEKREGYITLLDQGRMDQKTALSLLKTHQEDQLLQFGYEPSRAAS